MDICYITYIYGLSEDEMGLLIEIVLLEVCGFFGWEGVILSSTACIYK